MQYVLQVQGATPPSYILAVTRNSQNEITGYTETDSIEEAWSGTETEATSLSTELSGFVGTTPIRK